MKAKVVEEILTGNEHVKTVHLVNNVVMIVDWKSKIYVRRKYYHRVYKKFLSSTNIRYKAKKTYSSPSL